MSILRETFKQLKATSTFSRLREGYKEQMGYRRMGLVLDDLIPDESAVVSEALRRLPPREWQDRVFRFRRALNASMNLTELDQKDWTAPQEDVAYLSPIIRQVEYEEATAKYFDELELEDIPAALRKRNRSS